MPGARTQENPIVGLTSGSEPHDRGSWALTVAQAGSGEIRFGWWLIFEDAIQERK
jgi:hypothetical protein